MPRPDLEPRQHSARERHEPDVPVRAALELRGQADASEENERGVSGVPDIMTSSRNPGMTGVWVYKGQRPW